MVWLSIFFLICLFSPILEIHSAKQFSGETQQEFDCCVEGCLRPPGYFSNKKNAFNHIMSQCLGCPWCRRPESFETFELLIDHISVEHEIVVKIIQDERLRMSFTEKNLTRSKAPRNFIYTKVYICWKCEYIDVGKGYSLNHCCRKRTRRLRNETLLSFLKKY